MDGTTSAFYSIDQRNFSSVVSLVKFYCQNTLKENFPQLETTLGSLNSNIFEIKARLFNLAFKLFI